MPLEVKLSVKFAAQYDNYPEEDLDLIDAFWTHCERYPLLHWRGKVKPSWDLTWNYPNRSARATYARDRDLWHAHVGYPCWRPSRNPDATYQTSDYVLHFTYREGDDFLKLVEYSDHGNPFRLPTDDYLLGEW